jgi:cbb3-type cytochrome oxidase subunit 3
VSINKFKNKHYVENKKPSYLRYDDVFISRSNNNNKNRNYDPDNEEEDNGESEYFSSDENDENNILNEKILKYQKRKLPPLQRYKSPTNSKRMYEDYYELPSYYCETNDEYERKRQQYRDNGSVFKSIWQKFLITFGAILLLVCVAWIAYNCGNKENTFNNTQCPILIEPESQNFKILPENPGGIDVPHQDKIIYSQITGDSTEENSKESLLPPQEKASVIIPDVSIDEYSIVDEKKYYIKVSTSKSREVLENELTKVVKKYANKIGDMQCSIKSVKDKHGEKKYAILIGPAESKAHAINTARDLNTTCSVIAVKE